MPTKAEREGLLPVRARIKNNPKGYLPVKRAVAKEDVLGSFDLDRLNVHSLLNELGDKYEKNNDIGIIRSWFGKKKIEGQEKKLRAFLDLVDTIRRHAENLEAFRASLWAQEKRFSELVRAKEEEAYYLAEKQKQEYLTLIATEKGQREQIRLILERMKQENNILLWKGEQEKHKARLIELRGILIEKIIGECNFSDINMKQALVMIETLKDAKTEADIMTAEAKWDLMKAEAKKRDAEAETKASEAKQKKYKTQKMKTELEVLGVKLDEE